MVSVKVIPEKGVEYSVYEKNGKHRVYFKMNNGGGRPIEVGNYDILEGKFFPARGATLVWNQSKFLSENPLHQPLHQHGVQRSPMAGTTTTVTVTLSVVCVSTMLQTLLLTTLRIMLWMMPKSLRPSWTWPMLSLQNTWSDTAIEREFNEVSHWMYGWEW